MEHLLPTETQRLILRRFRESDLEDLHAYLANPNVVAFEPYKPMSLAETAENLKWRISTPEMIAVELKDTGRLIGNVYLGKREFDSLEIGFVFHDGYWNRGFARESCEKLITLAFQEGVHRIWAECDPANTHSWKLLERLGFSREAHLRQNVYFWKDGEGNPIWKDTYIYALLNEARQE